MQRGGREKAWIALTGGTGTERGTTEVGTRRGEVVIVMIAIERQKGEVEEGWSCKEYISYF